MLKNSDSSYAFVTAEHAAALHEGDTKHSCLKTFLIYAPKPGPAPRRNPTLPRTPPRTPPGSLPASFSATPRPATPRAPRTGQWQLSTRHGRASRAGIGSNGCAGACRERVVPGRWERRWGGAGAAMLRALRRRWDAYKYRFVPWLALNLRRKRR